MSRLKLDLVTLCLIIWAFLLGCKRAEIGPVADVSWLWILGPVLIPVLAVLVALGWYALVTLRDKYGR